MKPPPGMGKFEFVVIAKLRTAQLVRGCAAQVPAADHKRPTIAQLEVAAGKIGKIAATPDLVADLKVPQQPQLLDSLTAPLSSEARDTAIRTEGTDVPDTFFVTG